MKNGFTLIELMIVIGLIAVVTIGGVAGYRTFNLRQIVITSGKQMLVDLRQAQSKASSNVKSVEACKDQPMSGYRVAGSSGTYTITENYGGTCTPQVTKTVNLPSGVTFKNNFTLTFQSLGGNVTFVGASPYAIEFCTKNCLTGSGGLKYKITVSNQGLIQDSDPVAL